MRGNTFHRHCLCFQAFYAGESNSPLSAVLIQKVCFSGSGWNLFTENVNTFGSNRPNDCVEMIRLAMENF